MHRAMKAVLVVTVAGLVGMVGAQGALANDTVGSGDAYTHCYQGWHADFIGGVEFSSNHNGAATVYFGGRSETSNTHYYNDGQTSGYPDKSCDWSRYFNKFQYDLYVNSNWREGTEGLYGQYEAGHVGYQNDPAYGSDWTVKAAHSWAESIKCGIYWTAKSSGHETIPDYTPDSEIAPGVNLTGDPGNLGVVWQAGVVGAVGTTYDLLDTTATVPSLPVPVPLTVNFSPYVRTKQTSPVGLRAAHEAGALIVPTDYSPLLDFS